MDVSYSHIHNGVKVYYVDLLAYLGRIRHVYWFTLSQLDDHIKFILKNKEVKASVESYRFPH